MFLRMFGIGVTGAIAGKETSGIVTEVKTCWWLKVNTKAVRNGALDGAQFHHIIQFTYHVHGQTYTGKRYVNWNKCCPVKDEHITVHYEEASPEKYAVII